MTKIEGGSGFAGMSREELIKIVEGYNSNPELVWSKEAQEARRALGIRGTVPTSKQIQKIREARGEMAKHLAQAIVQARETDYPIATGEALKQSIDI